LTGITSRTIPTWRRRSGMLPTLASCPPATSACVALRRSGFTTWVLFHHVTTCPPYTPCVFFSSAHESQQSSVLAFVSACSPQDRQRRVTPPKTGEYRLPAFSNPAVIARCPKHSLTPTPIFGCCGSELCDLTGLLTLSPPIEGPHFKTPRTGPRDSPGR